MRRRVEDLVAGGEEVRAGGPPLAGADELQLTALDGQREDLVAAVLAVGGLQDQIAVVGREIRLGVLSREGQLPGVAEVDLFWQQQLGAGLGLGVGPGLGPASEAEAGGQRDDVSDLKAQDKTSLIACSILGTSSSQLAADALVTVTKSSVISSDSTPSRAKSLLARGSSLAVSGSK